MAQKMSDSPPGHFHAVRFYENVDDLSRIVAAFLGEGFTLALPGIVIATPEHGASIEAHLAAMGFDVEQLKAGGQLVVRDAQQMLAEVMVDGMPHPGRFRRALIPIIDAACGDRPACVIRTYGEMVDVLWKSGQTVAAIRLETLWNTLANSKTFSLLCGYSMGSVYKYAAVNEIEELHTHVVSEPGDVMISAALHGSVDSNR
jgi:hypothetical protein